MAEKTSRDAALVETGEPYLPEPRTALKESLVNLRFRIVYYVWRRQIRKHAARDKRRSGGVRFLEIGCGAGNFACCLERWFADADLTALDMSSRLLRYAAGRARTARFLQASAEELPFPDAAFDVVSALQVIEHFPNPDRFLAEARRVLTEGGLLLLATPNPRGLAARLLKERWQGFRHDHISLRPPEAWREALENSEFRILCEGTTLFNGIPILGRFPLGLPFQLLQAIFGWFPWVLGESYMVIAKKQEGNSGG